MEFYISNLLIEKGITSKEQLNIVDLSEAFKIPVVYFEQKSSISKIKSLGLSFIMIDNRKDGVYQYEDFLHELSHFILDEYHTESISKYRTFEQKANHVMQILSCPSHICRDKIKNIVEFSTEFNLTYRLAAKRISRLSKVREGEKNGYNNKEIGEEWERELANQISN